MPADLELSQKKHIVPQGLQCHAIRDPVEDTADDGHHSAYLQAFESASHDSD